MFKYLYFSVFSVCFSLNMACAMQDEEAPSSSFFKPLNSLSNSGMLIDSSSSLSSSSSLADSGMLDDLSSSLSTSLSFVDAEMHDDKVATPAKKVAIPSKVPMIFTAPIDILKGNEGAEERGRDLKRRADSDSSSPKKRFKTDAEVNFIFPLLLDNNPIEAEKEFFCPFRNDFIKKEYADDCSKKGRVSSPDARKIWKDNDTGNYFSGIYHFKGRDVFQADHLFDFTDDNLERMEQGLAPIAHNGQGIEIHHVTQRDRGIPEDPLCEMTRDAHMGFNARSIIERDKKTGKMRIVQVNLSKSEVNKLCKPNQDSVCNVLHFRQGPSLIDRDDFAEFRTDYWKARAAAYKAQRQLPKPPSNFERGQLKGGVAIEVPKVAVFDFGL